MQDRGEYEKVINSLEGIVFQPTDKNVLFRMQLALGESYFMNREFERSKQIIRNLLDSENLKIHDTSLRITFDAQALLNAAEQALSAK